LRHNPWSRFVTEEKESLRVMKPKIIVIAGPTGAGKSHVALELALKIDAEIIVADSVQVCRYMDIGTAKPTSWERALVPHHLLDIIDPDESFSAGAFRDAAQKVIAGLQQKKRNILVCGGTGLYLKALIRGLFRGPGKSDGLRQRFRTQEAEHGERYLHNELEKIDPLAAQRIHPKDSFRIIRALEIFHLTGTPPSQHYAGHAFQDARYDYLQIGLQWDRALLYERIEKRCDQMVANGIVDEVCRLHSRGYHSGLKSMQSLGYRHIGAFLEGLISLEEAVRTLKRDTRRYAKRQLTWFRADPSITWIDDPISNFPSIEKTVTDFLSQP